MSDQKPGLGDSGREPLTQGDVMRLFRNIENGKCAAILRTGATIEDLEEVAAWVAGEDDVMGDLEKPLAGAAAQVYEIVTADECIE
jgi:hypothetical protein